MQMINVSAVLKIFMEMKEHTEKTRHGKCNPEDSEHIDGDVNRPQCTEVDIVTNTVKTNDYIEEANESFDSFLYEDVP